MLTKSRVIPTSVFSSSQSPKKIEYNSFFFQVTRVLQKFISMVYGVCSLRLWNSHLLSYLWLYLYHTCSYGNLTMKAKKLHMFSWHFQLCYTYYELIYNIFRMIKKLFLAVYNYNLVYFPSISAAFKRIMKYKSLHRKIKLLY